MSGELIALVALAGFVLLVVAKTAPIVPQQQGVALKARLRALATREKQKREARAAARRRST